MSARTNELLPMVRETTDGRTDGRADKRLSVRRRTGMEACSRGSHRVTELDLLMDQGPHQEKLAIML